MTEVIISLQLCLWSLALPRCQWEGCSTPFRQKVADNIISLFLFCYCRTLPLEKCFLKIAVLKFQEFFLPFWNNYFKKHFWMAGSRKNLKLFSATKNKLKKMKKKKKHRKCIEAITVKALNECLSFKLPAKKCLYI